MHLQILFKFYQKVISHKIFSVATNRNLVAGWSNTSIDQSNNTGTMELFMLKRCPPPHHYTHRLLHDDTNILAITSGQSEGSSIAINLNDESKVTKNLELNQTQWKSIQNINLKRCIPNTCTWHWYFSCTVLIIYEQWGGGGFYSIIETSGLNFH